MKLLLVLSLLLLATSAFAQIKLNRPLKRELDSILVEDQRYRELIVGMNNGKNDSLETALHLPKGQLFTHIITNMDRVDSANLRRVEAIVQRYGYPGKSLVGTPTNIAAWYVIQHSPKISRYLPLIKSAADKGELPYPRYAQMLDRELMGEGKEQLYGTQGSFFTILNKVTGQRETVSFIWPIKDAAHVNARRKQAGFTNTVEESAAEMHQPYKPVTLAYAKYIQRQSRAK
jgi:hypothetical protein